VPSQRLLLSHVTIIIFLFNNNNNNNNNNNMHLTCSWWFQGPAQQCQLWTAPSREPNVTDDICQRHDNCDQSLTSAAQISTPPHDIQLHFSSDFYHPHKADGQCTPVTLDVDVSQLPGKLYQAFQRLLNPSIMFNGISAPFQAQPQVRWLYY